MIECFNLFIDPDLLPLTTSYAVEATKALSTKK